MELLIFWLVVAVLAAGLVLTVIQSLWGAVTTLATVLGVGFVLYVLFPAEVTGLWNLAVTAVLGGISLVIEGWYFIIDIVRTGN